MDPGTYLAIVDMTAKVATLVFKTKQLWDEIKDVPADISDLLQELQLTGRLFDALRVQLERFGVSNIIWDDRIMLDCLDSASTAQGSMESLVVDLQKQLDSSRKGRRHLTAAKIAMRKDTLQKYKDRLHGLTRLLQVAYHIVSVQLIPEITAVRVAKSIRQMPTSISTPLSISLRTDEEIGTTMGKRSTNKDTGSHSETSSRTHGTLWWWPLSYHGHVALAFSGNGEACSLYLQMPRWWSYKAWELTSTRTTFGGCFRYRVYNILPWDSEVFERARQGDSRRVKQMLDNGEASCLDFKSPGDSILHEALTFRRYELCLLLIHQYGMRSFLEEQDVVFMSRYGFNLLFGIIQYGHNSIGSLSETLPPDDVNNVTELCKLYQSHQSADWAMSWNSVMRSVILSYRFPTDYLDRFQAILGLGFDSPQPDGGMDVFHHAIATVNRPATALRLFRSGNAASAADGLQMADAEEAMLLHSAALAIGNRGMRHNSRKTVLQPIESHEAADWIDNDLDEWRAFGSQLLVKCGKEMPYLCPLVDIRIPAKPAHPKAGIWKGTSLTTLIGGWFFGRACVVRPWASLDTSLHSALHEWLKALLEAQVDLTKYGDAEVQGLAETKRAFDAEGFREFRPDLDNPLSQCPVDDDGSLSDYFVPIRVITFSYGPEIRHWRIYFASGYEWMAGQFWNMIERRPSIMPGTWVE